jgi:hypothetical protein
VTPVKAAALAAMWPSRVSSCEDAAAFAAQASMSTSARYFYFFGFFLPLAERVERRA